MTHQYQPRHGYWESLTVQERAVLTEVAKRSTFPAGTTLLATHDTSGAVMILTSGFAKVVVRAGAGQHLVLAVRGPGDIVGELGHVGGGQRSATVVAIDEVEALCVGCEEFTRLLHRYANASDVLRCTLVDRLCEADRDRLATASMTVGQRLARLLIKLVQRYGVPNATGDVTVGQLSQKELAACVGGARRTVVRELARWRDRHIISTTRLLVTVHRPDALTRIAGRHAPAP